MIVEKGFEKPEIVYTWFMSVPKDDSIHVQFAPDLTWPQVDQMSQANSTCPICFGRDACKELMSDMLKGALKVESQPQKMDNLAQTVHGIYRNGKVRFWMKTQPPSPSLLQGFENYICAKASGNAPGKNI